MLRATRRASAHLRLQPLDDRGVLAESREVKRLRVDLGAFGYKQLRNLEMPPAAHEMQGLAAVIVLDVDLRALGYKQLRNLEVAIRARPVQGLVAKFIGQRDATRRHKPGRCFGIAAS